jgi:hypothetical protein
MGEVMNILSKVLPRDVVHHHIQPYLMKSARQVKIGHYAVIKQLRQRVREINAEKKRIAEIKQRREREIKEKRDYHLRQIRSKAGWSKCSKCERTKKTYKRCPKIVLCKLCFHNKFKITKYCEPAGKYSLFWVTSVLIDEETGARYSLDDDGRHRLEYLPNVKFS